MTKRLRLFLLVAPAILALCALFAPAEAHSPTVGVLLNDPASSPGYTLFSQFFYPTTYLIDNEGRLVHSWNSGGGISSYLLEDGSLLRTNLLLHPPFEHDGVTFGAGGGQGRVSKFDWGGTQTWQFDYSTSDYVQHHDIAPLPNGNVLMFAWEYRSGAEAVTAGRDPALLRDGQLWPERIIEVEPTGPTTGNIVWEWYVWDHLVQDYDPGADNYGVVADHPELIDLNYFEHTRPATGEADWLHANGIDYNADLDQIVLSARHFSEFWVIDHSTTTAEAAGHSGGNSGKGGDLLYRWGNPQAYGAGDASDQQLFLQHDASWIPAGLPGAGNITVFNNGNGRTGGNYSSVEEIVPPVDASGMYSLTPGQAYEPAAPVWEYVAPNPSDFYASFISGAVRLPNGNTLICSGPTGKLFEVAPDGTIVWIYINPIDAAGPVTQGVAPGNNGVFQAHPYAPDYPGLVGKDLTPGAPLEITDSDGDGLTNDEELKTFGTDPFLADTDADGCTDAREIGPNERLGGRRDPLNPWDYFNPSGDGRIGVDDIMAVVHRYAKGLGDSAYDTKYDRTFVGPKMWDLGPPDGLISVTDILAIFRQFGHECA